MFLLMVLASVAHPAHSIDANFGDGARAMAERGQFFTGCPAKSSDKTKNVVGKWLVLTEETIQPTKLFVVKGRVVSKAKNEKYFFRNIPLQTGKYAKAQVRKVRTNTTARTESIANLNGIKYRFVEWGAYDFAITKFSMDGTILKMEVFGPADKAIPAYAHEISKERRHEEHGVLQIIRAGDFNADGELDLLLQYTSRATGLVLLLSDRKAATYSELRRATYYHDCER
jgi:hypothetical protein